MIIQEEEEQRVEVGDDRWDPHVREKLISKDDNTGSSLLTSVAGSQLVGAEICTEQSNRGSSNYPCNALIITDEMR